MLYPALTSSEDELQQILLLQQANHFSNIDDSVMKTEGFVSMQHSLPILKEMHNLAPSVIIKEDEKIVAYALTMLRECSALVKGLEPMFALFDTLNWNNKPLKDHAFYVMGQICVAKEYRGQGLTNMMYQYHKKIYQSQFDLLLTEIATSNHRSIRAHERAGFQTIHVNCDEMNEWAVVLWDWS